MFKLTKEHWMPCDLVKKFVRDELMPLEKNILDRFAGGQAEALSDEGNQKLFEQCKERALGRLRLRSGRIFSEKGFYVVPAGERLIIEMPGRGGYGDPAERERDLVQRDVDCGFVSPEQAEKSHGHKNSAK